VLGQVERHPAGIDVGARAVQQVHGAHAQLPFPQRAVQRVMISFPVAATIAR